jgi:two-component system, cell cycle response regulator DivK
VKSLFIGKSILIVDDDPTSALLFKEYLEPTNANIIIAYDGNSIFAILKNQPVHLVLLDIKLGDCNGFDLLPKIKAMNPKIIVIAQTANAIIDDYHKCIQAGFDDYLSKPINSSELYNKLSNHLCNNI